MPTLRDVADQANVAFLTAYQALTSTGQVVEEERRAVLEAARTLGYRLNITIRDVAYLAGVSTATVSYVINDSYPVSAETRERVLKAAAALGYRPNSTARNLQASETRLIGYAWHDLRPGSINTILDRFTYCLAQAAEACGYHVLTFAQPAGDVLRPYKELIQINRVDGFVIANTNRNDQRIRYLMDARIPFAAFGRANDRWDFPYVDVDGRAGIAMAVRHLIERGHTRIAILGWPEGSLSGDARIQGYFDALDSAAITPLPEWIIRTENASEEAFQAARRCMDLPPAQRPTAIACVTDTLALGVMNYLETVGLRVGQDVAVTGFDDEPSSALLRPPLTSLRQPIDQIGSQVVELLVAELNNEALPKRQILLAPTLIVRGSSDFYLHKKA